MLSYRQNLSKPFMRVGIEVFLYAVVGMCLGFAVTLLMPVFVLGEPWYTSLLYLLLQLIVDSVIIYTFDTAYASLFGIDADTYVGMTVFTYVYFLIQVQLYLRMLNLYVAFTGTELKRPPVLPGAPPPQPMPVAPAHVLSEFEYAPAENISSEDI